MAGGEFTERIKKDSQPPAGMAIQPKKNEIFPAPTPAAVQLMKHGAMLLPTAMFVLTGQYEGKRAGVIVRWVSQVASEPVMFSVSLRRGHWVSPLVRDSHFFGLSMITEADRLILRKFADTPTNRGSDAFDCLATDRLVGPVPIISKSALAFDCEVVRHIDLEADHEVFIGRALSARVSPELLAKARAMDPQGSGDEGFLGKELAGQ
jgi:flavin reductase (DIM6/NTAB) family NADH-FMN oxidoreductase RutF